MMRVDGRKDEVVLSQAGGGAQVEECEQRGFCFHASHMAVPGARLAGWVLHLVSESPKKEESHQRV